jgi:benzodiazapine receptor
MSPSLTGFLLDVPKNPVVAVGLPLTLGFLSGAGTKKAIDGIWYRVRP